MAWVAAAIAATVGCSYTDGFATFVLVCVAMGCAARAVDRAIPYPHGLREHRQ